MSTKAKPSERYRRGRKSLKSVHGQRGLDVIDGIEALSPDLARLVYEYAYGDVFSRPGLDPKSRQLATLGALIALGFARPQLKSHIHGALNLGWTKKQILEVIIQMTVYAGFPAALNALSVANEVFQDRKRR
jgi:4-carboxymuconolactone decarboxylase